jgi:UDP-N-acetylglucosamine 2-epimerase
MPEEINRVVTDHLSDLLFCPSEGAVEQLAKEGISSHVYNVGDVMYDAFLTFSALAKKVNPDIADVDMTSPFTLLTLHRPSNTDSKTQLIKTVEALGELPTKIIWPLHPRNREHIRVISLPPNITVTEPFSYLQLLLILERCYSVITDSGGLQKEAYWAKKPCITLREETEWMETLEGGWNQLASLPNTNLLKVFSTPPTQPWKSLYGDGRASEKIAQIILDYYYYSKATKTIRLTGGL